MFWYDREAKAGLYADKSTDDVIELGELPEPEPLEWETCMLELLDLAREIDDSLSLNAYESISTESVE